MWDNATITMLLEGTRDTLYMTLVSTFFGYVLGLPLGILLAVTDKEGIRPNAPLYKVLDVIVNILRSIPFLILLILVIPLTKLIVGQSYGSSATIVPLVIAAAPFIARMVESSRKEVEPGGRRNRNDHLESPSRRGKNFPPRRSYHCSRNDPRIFCYGRNCRRWRSR